MRKVCLDPLKHFLGANALSDVDQTEKRNPQIVGDGRSTNGAKHVNDSPVKSPKLRRFFEERFAAKSALHGALQRAQGGVSPEPLHGTEHFDPIPRTEHLDRVVVDLFDDKRLRCLREQVRMLIDVDR